VYPPFFQTTTMGSCLDLLQNAKSEYDRSVFYGRPLFAHLAITNKLEEKITSILLRMLRQVDWKKIRETWMNIFATRVQMGQTSADMASRLVANKYANFCGYNDETKAVHLGYLPDPVCARLAMCMMDETFELKGPSASDPIMGMNKRWWTEKLKEIFSSGIVSPEKGNFGEVVVALYMLFCGDLLRKRINDDNMVNGIQLYSQFSVSLDDWLEVMLSGGKMSAIQSDKESDVSVGFIQICRNHLRSYSHSWKTLKYHEFLKQIFESGIAFYACNNCPLIDIVVPLRIRRDDVTGIDVDSGSEFTYAPMLVSIKCHAKFSQKRAEAACEIMKAQAIEDKLAKAFCLLIVFGCDDNAMPFTGDIAMGKDSVGVSELLKSGGIVSKAIRITEDEFGLTDAFHAMTSSSQMSAELFSSHSFLKAHGGDTAENKDIYAELNAEHALRRNSSSEWKKTYSDLRSAVTHQK
jgi:hypothetical protein